LPGSYEARYYLIVIFPESGFSADYLVALAVTDDADADQKTKNSRALV
jgi:hypothetical protein